MQNTPLINATIELVEMSNKKGQNGLIKKIKGKNIETGQTNTYTIYQTKADGSTSVAWNQLENINVGDTVQVGYAEKQGTMQDGTPFTSRIVRSLNPDIGNGHRQYVGSQSTKSPNLGQNNASSEPYKERNWEREAYEKCCSIWSAAHIQAGDINAATSALENGWYLKLFQAIKQSGEKNFEPSKFRQIVQEKAPRVIEPDLPTIQQDEDAELGADIPF